MANLTRDGIFYKLKFISKQKDNREKINLSLTNRFGFEIKNNLLCDLKLYAQIEKRGFLIFNAEGEMFECRKSIALDGQRVIAKI